jgi:hypothetical protein
MVVKFENIHNKWLKLIIIFSFFSYYIDGNMVLSGWNLKFQIQSQPHYQKQLVPSGVYDYTDDIRTPMVLLNNPNVILNRTLNSGYIDSVKLKLIKPIKPILIIEHNDYKILN